MENEKTIQDLYKNLIYCLYLSQNVENCTSEIIQIMGKAVEQTREQMKKS